MTTDQESSPALCHLDIMFPRRITVQARFLCKTMTCVTCFLTLYFLFTITVFQQSFYIIAQNSTSLEQNDSGLHKHSDYMFDINAAAHLPEVKNLSSKAMLHVIPDKNNYTDQMERFYRLKPSKVNLFTHTFVISGDGICDSDTYMVTLVHSWHKYTDRRKAIRATWGSTASGQGWPHANVTSKLKLAFIFGTHPQRDMNALIAREHDEHQDIIQGSFVEDYKNMTLKSLLGLKWVATRCPQAKFLLKSDDDMMIDIPSLVDSLNFTALERTIVGPYCPHSKVFRRGKWGLTMAQYPFTFYPPYFAGSSYVFTTDLIGKQVSR